MTKATICSIAVGESYYKNFLSLVDNLLEYNSPHLDFLLVTDIVGQHPGCSIININNDSHKLFIKHGNRNEFNFNLKYLPIKYSYQNNTQCIIFIDSDWQLYKKFCINKMLNFIEVFMDSGADFIFERPHPIGSCKKDNQLFWRHKINLYELKNTNKYDNAHVVNEQFLVFKNSDKIKIFVDSWEKKNTICLDNNIRPWAEGVEIGMSYTDAGMVAVNKYHHILKECFTFLSKSGQQHIRW